jgi:hypothetical protein
MMMRVGKMKLSDFLVERGGHCTYNFERLMQISDSDFILAHDNEMDEYIRNHKKFTGGFPKCSACNLELTDPKRLIRYYGMNLHGGCLVTEYLTDKYPEMKPEHEAYFDRMLRLVACSKSVFNFNEKV